jgi:hypothetical protein
MKFEIDLNDILGDEFGAETLQESVKRQVIGNLTEYVKKGVMDKLNIEVSAAIDKAIGDELTEKMPVIIDDVLNVTYTPVDQWGSRKTPTTFREQLVKSIHENMTYKKVNSRYDRNFFTQAVDEIIESEMKEIQKKYKEEVDSGIAKEAFNAAVSILRSKLGL